MMSLNEPQQDVKRTFVADGFLGGRLQIHQSATGFRAGTDSVLLGAAVRRGSGPLLDLGAGAGVAGLVALAWHRELAGTFVERDPEALELCKSNIASNALADRAFVCAADIADPPSLRAAGLPRDHFATVIANPPYFDSGTATPPGDGATAHLFAPGSLDAWMKAAVTAACADGEIIFIHRAAALPELLAACERRLGAVTVLPLAARPGTPAERVLVRGQKGSRAPFRLLAPLVLHHETGNGFCSEVADILQGKLRLDW